MLTSKLPARRNRETIHMIKELARKWAYTALPRSTPHTHRPRQVTVGGEQAVFPGRCPEPAVTIRTCSTTVPALTSSKRFDE